VTRDRDGARGESGNGEVTHLLARWADGDRAALDALTPIVYGELRKIADAFLHAEKRGGGSNKTDLDEDRAVDIGAGRIVEFLALDQALTQLSRVSARQAQVIELRYFAGLNLDEISGLLGVSPATISRDQRSAEAWLSHVMSDRNA
jgi:RNA polymerase sigma factor (sigma-70 family)